MTDVSSSMASDWSPGCRLDALHRRAQVMRTVREFFARRQVLEVETPLLAHGGATDIHLASLRVPGGIAGAEGYLQTSPEFAMKRLLAAGSGPIFQICKAFRAAERGSRHNPEFTLLEWYRPGFSLQALMHEVSELLQRVGIASKPGFRSYRELFLQYVALDPFAADEAEIQQRAAEVSGMSATVLDRDEALDVLLTHLIEPNLGQGQPEFVYGYPASQAALAKVEIIEGYPQARRFELYLNGLELANGYDELVDADEQRRRFEADNQARVERGLPPVSIDRRLLAALAQGMPDCAGVALGVDRLLMCLMQTQRIDEVMAFTIDRA